MLSEELQKEYDRQSWILVERYGNLLGCDDELEAEYYFISFCTKYARHNENRWHQLHEYVHNKESVTASPQHPIAASPQPSTSSAPAAITV